MKASVIVNHMKSAAPRAANDAPKCQAEYAAPRPASSSTRGYFSPMGALQFEQRPFKKAKLTSGIFSSAPMPLPQEGQRDRGTIRLYVSWAGSSWPESSAHSARQARSIIFGRRWMATLRNEPMHSPETSAIHGKTAG